MIEPNWEKSIDFWEHYRLKTLPKLEEELGIGDKSDENGDKHEFMVCKSHLNAILRGRTSGFVKGKDKEGKEKRHGLVLAKVGERGEEPHITFNEQGFIWEDPEYMEFQGPSTSKPNKKEHSDLYDKEDCWWGVEKKNGDVREVDTWKIHNLTEKKEWAEKGYEYVNDQ